MQRKSEFKDFRQTATPAAGTDFFGLIRASPLLKDATGHIPDVHSKNNSTLTALSPVRNNNQYAPARGMVSERISIKRYEPEVQAMAKTYNNFEAFKDTNPGKTSKVDFQNFKASELSNKNLYDTNLSPRLTVEHKILASKSRQQALRAIALAHNVHSLITMMDTHTTLTDQERLAAKTHRFGSPYARKMVSTPMTLIAIRVRSRSMSRRR
jgi:hypothetical protein